MALNSSLDHEGIRFSESAVRPVSLCSPIPTVLKHVLFASSKPRIILNVIDSLNIDWVGFDRFGLWLDEL